MQTNQPQQVMLSEHDDVVEQLAPQYSHKSFSESILPRRSRRDEKLANAHVLDASIENCAVDAITVANQTTDGRLEPDSLDDLLRGRCCVVMRGNIDVQDASRWSESTKKT